MKHKHTLALSCTAIVIAAAVITQAGPLDPPAGAVKSSYKTLTEIEPRIAVNATNTAGDTNSVFRITQPGSYYLTENVLGQSAKIGIEINASGVTLDLNGFDVVGVPGSLDGIRTDAGADTSITIINGSIRNWGGSGVNLASFTTVDSVLDHLIVTGNGTDGIDASTNAVISHCVASNNAVDGISSGSGAVITECTASSNGRTGIGPSSGSTVAHCSAFLNVSSGISLASGGTATSCNSRSNGGHGIGTSSQCIVTNCNVSTNTANGIRCAGSGSLIEGNVCSLNGINAGDGAGIAVVSVDNTVVGNHCQGNDRGIDVSAAGNLILRNTCANNPTNFLIVADNRYGPIVNITGTGTAAVNGSSAASTLTTTDANANFAY